MFQLQIQYKSIGCQSKCYSEHYMIPDNQGITPSEVIYDIIGIQICILHVILYFYA